MLKKRILSGLLVIAMVISLFPGVYAAAEDTVQIGTWEQFLAFLSAGSAGRYELVADISAPADLEPLGGFTAKSVQLEGNGHTVSGLKLTGALFTALKSAAIRDVVFSDVTVAPGAGSDMAVLALTVDMDSFVSGCSFRQIRMSPVDTSARVAVVAARNQGTITNCTVEETVTVSSVGAVKDGLVGGIAALNDSYGYIINCISRAVYGLAEGSKVTVGGIVGSNHSVVQYCFTDMTGQEGTFQPVVGSASGTEQLMDRCLYLAGGVFTMLGGQTGKDYASMDVYQLAAEMTELVMNEYDQNLDLTYFSEKELACPWSVENGSLALSLDGKTAQIYLYVDQELEDAVVTTTDLYARKVDPDGYTGRKYTVRVGRRGGQGYERNSFTVSLALPYETMAKNFILRPNPGFVKKLANGMDGTEGTYSDMYLAPSRTDGGVTQTYTATKGLYPFAMTLSLTQMKPGDGLAPYCFVGTGTAESPYQISTLWELSLMADYVADGASANGTPFSRAHYVLTKDLDLTGWTQTTMEPIGSIDAPFRGVFDGQGHWIRGFKVNNSRSYMGLFGVVQGDAQTRAAIRDLVVYDVTITGPENALAGDLRGGVVGRASYADLVGLVAEGSVSGGTQIGGIAGYTYHCDILGCGSVMELTSRSSRAWVGGIVGNAAYGTVENCYADVDYVHKNVVRNEYLQVGTIAGELKEAQLVHCWYDGAENTALFDVGYTSAADKATMTSADFARRLADYASGMELGVVWQSRAGQAELPYPAPIPDSLAEHSIHCAKSSQGTLVADKSSAVAGTAITVRPDQVREGAVLEGIVVLDRNYQVLDLAVTAHDDGSWSFVMPSRSVYVAPVFDTAALYGMGTEEAPYLIRSIEDLRLMGQLVAAGTPTLEGCTAYQNACYRMTADIDCGGEFLPNIGNGSHPFYGWFNGDGHAIHNFYGNATGFFVLLRQSVVSHGISVSDLVFRDGEGNSTAVLARTIQSGVKIQDVEFRDITFYGTSSVLALEIDGQIVLANCQFRDIGFNAAYSDNALLTQVGIDPSLENVVIFNVTGCTKLNAGGSTSGGKTNVICTQSDITDIGDQADVDAWTTMARLSGRAENMMEDASLWGEDPDGGTRLVFGGAGAVSWISYSVDFDAQNALLDTDTAPIVGKGGTHIQIPYDPLISIADLVVVGPNGKITPIVTETEDGTPVVDFLMPEGEVYISNGGKAFRFKGLPGSGTASNPYLIETAQELRFFASVCNGDIPLDQLSYNVPYPEASVRLLNDISMEGIEWDGIGGAVDTVPFTGCFDGDGHTISGLNRNDRAEDAVRQPLFIQVGPAGVVEDLVVTGARVYTDTAPEVGTGVIAKNNAGTIRRCLVTQADIRNDADTYCGGIVGVNRGYLEDCGIAESTITRTESTIGSGAVVHSNFGTVSGCFSYDVTIQGGVRHKGAVLINNDGALEGYYYTQVETMESLTGTTAMTREEFHDGAVAFLLNDGVTDGTQSFYQILDSATPADLWPVPVVKEGGMVYKSVCTRTPYTNTDEAVDHFKDAVNGFCPYCGAYQPAVLVDDGADVYEYQVSNAGQLFWVAREQNENQSAVAMDIRLMADIDVNPGYTFHADGTVTYEGQTVTEGWRSWTPIGIYTRVDGMDHQYHGNFMGDGHTVSGLYVDDPEAVYVGLIGYSLNGWVTGVSVVNTYFRAAGFVGGVVGGCSGNVRDCFSSATVQAVGPDIYMKQAAGSLLGDISYKQSQVRDTVAVGTANGSCVSVGDYSFAGLYENNFYLSDTETEDGGRTAEQLASGEVCMALQSDTSRWGQKIGSDPYPVLGGPKVYAERWCNGELIRYSNEDLPPVHVAMGEDGVCPGCGEPAPAILVDGVYEIFDLGNLIWFGQKIVEDPYVKGRQMADITVISDSWIPLGSGVEFRGSYDGQGHTVTMELDFGTEPCDQPVGLFSNTTSGAAFRNLVLKGSVVCNSDERVGALVGSAYNTIIENVLSYVDVTNTCTEVNGSNSHPGTGGITGLFGGGSNAIMRDCAVYADVTAGYACVGGLVGRGWPGKQYYQIENCAFVGDVTATVEIPAGAVVGYHDTESNMTLFENIYYNEADGLTAFGKMDGTEGSTYMITKVEQKSLQSFGSGEVAYLLGTGFGQELGVDAYPIPGGMAVYRGYDSCSEQAVPVYSNDSAISPTRLPHKYEIPGYTSQLHWYDCACGAEGEHAQHELEVFYDADGHWYACDCGYESAPAPHVYDEERWDADGCWMVCECGSAVPGLPELTLDFPSLSFEDEIHYNVYFTVDRPERIESMGLAVFDSHLEEGTVGEAVSVVEGFVTNGTHYMVRTEGIAAKDMGDTVYFRVYARLDNGDYVYSAMGGYDATAYAKQILGDTQTSDEMKSLAVALIRYGAEAQKYFGHHTDTLMDSFLSEDQKALVADYDPALVEDLVTVPADMTGDFLKTEGGYEGALASFSFEGALALNVYMGTALPVDGEVTLYWWDMQTASQIGAFTMDNATDTLTMVPTGVEGHHWASIEGIPAKYIDKTVYFAAVYESDGAQVVSKVYTYSVGEYCKQHAARDGSDQQDFAKATAVYGYHAKTYFQSIGMM